MTYTNNKYVQTVLNSITKKIYNLIGLERLKNFIVGLHDSQLARIEFMRNEILLEMKYSQLGSKAIETRIINKKKYEQLFLQNELVLNIGSGHNCVENMVNVDMRELPNVDVVADAADIRLPQGIAKGIFCSHVLEHFPHEKLRRTILPNWAGLLCDGGFFRAIVPDAEGMLEAYARGDMSFADLRTVTFGLQEYEGDTHYTMFSRDTLKLLLEEAGLHDINYVVTSRANGLCLEMEVLAYK
jgi:predicted SAM-dependent methyltransferase